MSEPKVSLDVLRVKEPCTQPWARMLGDGPVRFCGTCRMNVYNLSAMTRDEAEATVREREGRLCVRFYRRADGTVTVADCAPLRFAAARKAARRAMTGAAALFVSLLALVTSLGLFRLSGIDVASWFEGSAIGELAKVVQSGPEAYPVMGEMEMGAAEEWHPPPAEPPTTGHEDPGSWEQGDVRVDPDM